MPPSAPRPVRRSRLRRLPLSAGPLVIEASAAQTLAQRRTSGALAALGWLAWVVLWLPLATLLVWLFFGVELFAPAWAELDAHLSTILVPFAAGAVLSAALAAWALYNLLRFRRARRRRRAQRASAADIAREMRVSEEALRKCWKQRRIVVHHDEHGAPVVLESSVRRRRLARRVP